MTETITITRHIAAREVIASMNLAPLADLHDPDTPEPRAVDGRGRSAQTFVVDARVRDGNHERGEPPAGATSTPSPRRLLLGEDRGASGARAPGDIFDAGGFLEALAPDQFTLAFWTRKVREGGGPGAAGRYLYCPDGSHLALYDDQVTYFHGLIDFIREVDEGRFRST